jgi:hypothetical protein
LASQDSTSIVRNFHSASFDAEYDANRMKSIVEILRLAGLPRQGTSIQVQNAPWEDLWISGESRLGPNGFPTISVGWGSQDDPKAPEMSFEIHRWHSETEMMPLSLRKDAASQVELCATENSGCWMITKNVQRRQRKFADAWDKEILKRGYVAAFRRSMNR